MNHNSNFQLCFSLHRPLSEEIWFPRAATCWTIITSYSITFSSCCLLLHSQHTGSFSNTLLNENNCRKQKGHKTSTMSWKTLKPCGLILFCLYLQLLRSRPHLLCSLMSWDTKPGVYLTDAPQTGRAVNQQIKITCHRCAGGQVFDGRLIRGHFL